MEVGFRALEEKQIARFGGEERGDDGQSVGDTEADVRRTLF